MRRSLLDDVLSSLYSNQYAHLSLLPARIFASVECLYQVHVKPRLFTCIRENVTTANRKFTAEFMSPFPLTESLFTG